MRDIRRILDANGNRAREAVRVCEEYVRFSWNDAGLSARWRSLRHAIAHLMRRVPGGRGGLVSSRDVAGDVGPAVSRARKGLPRATTSDVLHANLARLTESLRCVEEYLKPVAPDLAPSVERLRFEAYRLESAMFSRLDDRRRRLAAARLTVLVTHDGCRLPPERLVPAIVRAGVDVIQLREKGMEDRRLVGFARRLCALAHREGALFIMNDRADIARAVEADGVHVGKSDLPIEAAREILGPERLIGATSHRRTEAAAAERSGADYVSVGPVFSSALKPGLAPSGLPAVREAASGARKSPSGIPFVAIGGITPENVGRVRKAGARHVAVCRAVCESRNPAGVVRRLLDVSGR